MTSEKMETINESVSREKRDPTGIKVWSTSLHLSGGLQQT